MAVLALLGLLAPRVAVLTLAICAAAVIVAVVVADSLTRDRARAMPNKGK